MMHFADRSAWQWVSPSILVAGLWSGSAVATAVYDIGRWVCAW
jgi:hypothetical protein